jgi:hypothetical protein
MLPSSPIQRFLRQRETERLTVSRTVRKATFLVHQR